MNKKASGMFRFLIGILVAILLGFLIMNIFPEILDTLFFFGSLVYILMGIAFMTGVMLLINLIEKRETEGKKMFVIKGILTFILWWITFTVGISISDFFLIFIPNYRITFIYLLFTGIVMECVSRIMQRFRYGVAFKIDKYFIFWVLVLSIALYIGFKFVYPFIERLFSINTFLFRTEMPFGDLPTIIVSLFVTIIVYLVRKMKLTDRVFKK